MYTKEQEVALITDLLYLLDCNIDERGIIMSNETLSPIQFEGKFIKTTRNPLASVYISENDIELKPLEPKYTKLMECVFGYYLDAEERMGNLPHALSIYFNEFPEEKKLQLAVKFEDGSIYTSPKYYSRALLYTASIFILDGSFNVDHFVNYDIDIDLV